MYFDMLFETTFGIQTFSTNVTNIGLVGDQGLSMKFLFVLPQASLCMKF